jgi:DNA-directed RNA polymerase specialized sigma24 family protein
MSPAEAAQALAVWVTAVHRRLSRCLQRLAAALGALYPGDVEPDAP